MNLFGRAKSFFTGSTKASDRKDYDAQHSLQPAQGSHVLRDAAMTPQPCENSYASKRPRSNAITQEASIRVQLGKVDACTATTPGLKRPALRAVQPGQHNVDGSHAQQGKTTQVSRHQLTPTTRPTPTQPYNAGLQVTPAAHAPTGAQQQMSRGSLASAPSPIAQVMANMPDELERRNAQILQTRLPHNSTSSNSTFGLQSGGGGQPGLQPRSAGMPAVQAHNRSEDVVIVGTGCDANQMLCAQDASLCYDAATHCSLALIKRKVQSMHPVPRSQQHDRCRNSPQTNVQAPAQPMAETLQKKQALHRGWHSERAQYQREDATKRAELAEKERLRTSLANYRSAKAGDAELAQIQRRMRELDLETKRQWFAYSEDNIARVNAEVERTLSRPTPAAAAAADAAAPQHTPDAAAPPSADEDLVDLASSEEEEPAAEGEEPSAAPGGLVEDEDGAILLSSDEEGPLGGVQEAGDDDDDDAYSEASEESLDLNTEDFLMSAPQRSKYQYISAYPHDEDTAVTHEDQKIDVAWTHLATCAPDEWLADPIMNCYISLLQDRDTSWRDDPNRARCLFMSSHFVSKLCQEAGGYNYENVRRWMGAKKMRRINLTHITGLKELDKVIVPVHLGNHWTCAVLNFRDCQIEYYDSLGGVDSNTVQSLLRWAMDDIRDKYGEEPTGRFDTTQWKRVFNPPNTPKQRNGVDCGVFALMACNYAGADKQFDYQQKEVYNLFRAMIALEVYYLRLREL